MSNGWTGGQYSLFRVLCGLYLLVHFAMLVPYGAELFSDEGVLPDPSASPLVRLFPNVLAIADAPAVVVAVLVAAAIASVFFMLGWLDRLAAVLMWYVLACLFGRNPLIANPSLPFIGWLLLAHAFLPPAPYGSLAARGRTDPGGGWRFSPELFAATWIVMSLAYAYSGWTKLVSPSWTDGTAMARILENPLARPGHVRDLARAAPPLLLQVATWGALGLELAFAPLALFRRARRWIWLAMTLLHCGLVLLIDFADLSLGMLVFHLFAFDPGWIRPWRPGATETVFFDGTCGLCHRAVRFLIAEDPAGAAFDYSPLDGERARATIQDRSHLPDSVAIRTSTGEILTRSTAILHAMKRLGGIWRALGTTLSIIPRPLRNAVYDVVARMRYRVFGRAKEACPLLPADLRSRFRP